MPEGYERSGMDGAGLKGLDACGVGLSDSLRGWVLVLLLTSLGWQRDMCRWREVVGVQIV